MSLSKVTLAGRPSKSDRIRAAISWGIVRGRGTWLIILTGRLVHVDPCFFTTHDIVHFFALEMRPHGNLSGRLTSIMRPQRRRRRGVRIGSVLPLTWFVMFHLYGHVGQTLRHTESARAGIATQTCQIGPDLPSVLRRVLRVADGEVVGAVRAEQHGEPRNCWAGAWRPVPRDVSDSQKVE